MHNGICEVWDPGIDKLLGSGEREGVVASCFIFDGDDYSIAPVSASQSERVAANALHNFTLHGRHFHFHSISMSQCHFASAGLCSNVWLFVFVFAKPKQLPSLLLVVRPLAIQALLNSCYCIYRFCLRRAFIIKNIHNPTISTRLIVCKGRSMNNERKMTKGRVNFSPLIHRPIWSTHSYVPR